MTYRPGNHWGVTIVREAGRQPCDEPGPHYCFALGENAEHKADELVAVIVNGDRDIAQRICNLLNLDQKISRSSLGTPGAVAARESVDDETALGILERSRQIADEDPAGRVTAAARRRSLFTHPDDRRPRESQP